MNIITKFFRHREEKRTTREENCKQLMYELNKAILEVESIFKDKEDYIDMSHAQSYKDKWSYLLTETSPLQTKELRRSPSYESMVVYRVEFIEAMESISQRIHHHNDKIAMMQINQAYALIGDVERRKLDHQQMLCIVKRAHNHLVIAGAGTGKTTTIVGKIKYLLKSEFCKAEDILVLSFTNASAKEMKERIDDETGESIDASTFHKLGLNIIAKVDGVKPKISKVVLNQFVKAMVTQYLAQPEYVRRLVSYLYKNKVIAKSEFDFGSEEEYKEYLQLNPPLTLKNEAIKSYGEMEIANFLNQNGIHYIYEHPYPIDTRSEEYGQYHPDFYLPDYNVFIEYFGVNRNGAVPSYFKEGHNKSAKERYNEEMMWKKQLHRDHGTTLVECFAYEKLEGILLKNLADKLVALGVELHEKAPEELWKELSTAEPTVLDGLVELFVTVINLMKSNDFTTQEVLALNQQRQQNLQANEDIIWLVDPLLSAYNKQLQESGEIDFNDMINVATRYVQKGQFEHNYKVVIVDEYQDISRSRYSLLKAMRDSKDYDLFCVGDDWQSIYRFAGSDIGFILNFEKYWGVTEKSKIETTYRFSQKLIEVSGSFVMQNPMQIQKSIVGKVASSESALGEVCGYTEKVALEFLASKIQDFPQGSSVYFIGRYSFDADLLSNCELFTVKYNNVTKMVDVVMPGRKDLNMQFLTAHKSKGLQADYVIIINNKKTRMGFPSKVQDAPVLQLLLDDCDTYPYSEERRLFYVALTRAKKKVILLTQRGNESIFVHELKDKYGNEMKREAFECPLCGGHLIKKKGPYGEFWGCINYKSIGCKYSRNAR